MIMGFGDSVSYVVSVIVLLLCHFERSREVVSLKF